MSPRRFVVAAALGISMLAPASAMADVEVAGTGEPTFTRSTTNTQWISWDAPGTSDGYQLRITHFKDGAQVSQSTSASPLSGTDVFVSWGGVQTLEEGHTYEICVQGLFSEPADPLFFEDGNDSCENGELQGKRTETTVDLTKPTVSVELAGGAARILGPSVPLEITYNDNLAPPFPANFLCQQLGTDASACDGQIFGESAQCSVPVALTNPATFTCNLDTSALDTDAGEFFACVRSADSALPDNAVSSTQTFTASQANLSDPACDSVDLLNAECEAAKDALKKAKAKLRRLKQRDASDEKIAAAKKAVRKAKRAVRKACA